MRTNKVTAITPGQARAIADALRRLGLTPYNEAQPGPFRSTVSWTVGKPEQDIAPEDTGSVVLIKEAGNTDITISEVTNPHLVTLLANKRVLVHELDGWKGLVATPWEYVECETITGPLNIGGP